MNHDHSRILTIGLGAMLLGATAVFPSCSADGEGSTSSGATGSSSSSSGSGCVPPALCDYNPPSCGHAYVNENCQCITLYTPAGTPCNGAGMCDGKGVCLFPPKGFGTSCLDDSECESTLCLPTHVCSKSCTTAADCPPAPEWTCDGMCQCTPSGSEVCDGRDNDCNTSVDDGAACGKGEVCTNGACVCEPNNLCNGVCTDPTSDPQNCGACGTICAMGFGCLQRQCMPILASGQSVPRGIAVDATNVYWTNSGDGTVMKVPIAGGVPTTLASGQGSPYGIAVDATNVYWTTNDSVMKAPLGGGAPSVVAAGQSAPWRVVVNATNISWANSIDNTVKTVPLGGGAEVTVASGGYLVAMDDANIYWTTYGTSVMKAPVGGGVPTTVVSQASLLTVDIAVDTTHVYFTANPGGPGAVMKVPIGGGAPTMLASEIGSKGPGGIVVDAANVYWIGSGSVMKVPIGGGVATAVVVGQSPSAIAVDATSVYWTDSFGGNIVKIPK